MMAYLRDKDPLQRKNPKLRPDYVLKRKGKVVAVLDAKYSNLWNYGLPSSMLYQLGMYALSYESCKVATILYPSTEPAASEEKIEIRLPSHEREYVYVVLRPVNLLELADLISSKDNLQRRLEFARMLAFGTV